MKNPDGLAPLSGRDKVAILEERILADFNGAQNARELPIVHHFAPGLYARESFIPKGTVVTGAVHKYTQLNIMSKGVLDLFFSEENCWKRVEAPFHIVSPPGTKRLAIAIEDTVWTTIFGGTDETDVDLIIAQRTCPNDREYKLFLEREAVKEIA